ncbi:MAG: hypothetical protein LBQ13_03015, partial [Endomicrobium sp.]|nr:hypothetical protein [Endomicrobium sp.]
MIVLEVAIPIPLNKTFHYLAPENINPKDTVGKRVKVQFGNRILTGYAVACQDISQNAEGNIFLKLKRIIKVIDNCSLITQETMELAEYISKNYICSLGEALASIIPASMKLPKRISKNKNTNSEVTKKTYDLSIEQTNAVNLINDILGKNIYASFLLHGVTASGKTEVYINSIEYALRQNRSAIMLIPEISFTPQLVYVMTKRFGANVGVWHSDISNIEKYKLFLKAKNSDIKVIIGTRSAIFTP